MLFCICNFGITVTFWTEQKNHCLPWLYYPQCNNNLHCVFSSNSPGILLQETNSSKMKKKKNAYANQNCTKEFFLVCAHST